MCVDRKVKALVLSKIKCEVVMLIDEYVYMLSVYAYDNTIK